MSTMLGMSRKHNRVKARRRRFLIRYRFHCLIRFLNRRCHSRKGCTSRTGL